MIFLDSSFIITYKIENDEHHEKASELMKKIIEGSFGLPVISDYVFDEVITVVFSKIKELNQVIEFGNELRESINWVWVDEDIFDHSWRLFELQKETKFSFTDCSILAIMDMFKIKNIATFDEDFRKVKRNLQKSIKTIKSCKFF